MKKFWTKLNYTCINIHINSDSTFRNWRITRDSAQTVRFLQNFHTMKLGKISVSELHKWLYKHLINSLLYALGIIRNFWTKFNSINYMNIT